MVANYLNMNKKMLEKQNNNLFELLPEDIIVSSVERAFDNVLNARYGSVSVKKTPFASQVICATFHELIVYEIARLPGWRRGKQNKEADLVHISGFNLQIKTKSLSDGISGNRHSKKIEYSNPNEHYICVNFIPNKCICKIRAGWVNSLWWKPQSGKGNASSLKKDKLDLLPLLYGSYLKNVDIIALPSFGEKTVSKLQKINIFNVNDFLNQENYLKAKKILDKKQILHIDEMLCYLLEKEA